MVAKTLPVEQKTIPFQRDTSIARVDSFNAPAPLKSPKTGNPFQYIQFTPEFCRLLEQSAAIAATDYETAIMSRLAGFADYLVPLVNRIEETPLTGVYTLTFEGSVSRGPLTAIDTSRMMRTVGNYQVGQGSWSIAVRLVR